jgi:hypothetical protein
MDQLSFATTKVYDQSKEAIRDMVGIQIPFQYPYYLFFSIEDLTDDTEDNIYFVGYEMKSPGPAFWGYIDKENYKITIYGSCIYRTNLLNDIVKQWKRNNLKYIGSSIKNKQYPRIKYDVDDLNKKYQMSYSEFEEEKYLASYFRDEISKKDLPKDLDEKKLKKFFLHSEWMNEEEIMEWMKEIDKKNFYLTIPLDQEKTFEVPRILVTPDYERYKAFYALLTNKITEKQFRKLYPWKYALDVLDMLLYDFFGYKKSKLEDVYFWDMYEDEKDVFLDELLNQIRIYEDNMNRVDTTYRMMKDMVDVFFEAIQSRKLKIVATESCPEISQCETLSGGIDQTDKSCMVYYYPEGLKRGNMK